MSLRCPVMVMQKTKYLTVDLSTSERRVRRKFDISIGQTEAIDILAVNCEINHDSAVNADAGVVDVGVSYIDSPDQNSLALQTAEVFYERDDWLAVFNLYKRSMTAAGIQYINKSNFIKFPVPICLVRDPILEVNARVFTTNQSLEVICTLWYVKKSLANSVIMQLLKFYGDAKQAFRAEPKGILDQNYDT